MKAWFSAHRQAFLRAWKRHLAHPASSIFSILVIGIAAAMPLGLFMVFSNVTTAASRVDTDPNISLYFTLATTDAAARGIEKQVKALPNIASVRYVPREAALAEMKKIASFSELLEGLGSNPLPHALVVRPASTDATELAALRIKLVALPGVDKVVMDFEWAKKLKRFAAFAENLVTLLALVLGFAVMFVTGNTIRLQLLTQRDEIEVSRLIGASRPFVRRPFLYFGALQGAFAGVVAVALVYALTAWVGGEVSALAASYESAFALRPPPSSVSIAVIAVCAILGWLGALVSVRVQFARLEREESRSA